MTLVIGRHIVIIPLMQARIDASRDRGVLFLMLLFERQSKFQ